MKAPIEWLVESEPWVEYNTRKHILKQSDDDSQIISARQKMVSHPAVQNLIDEVSGWPGAPLISHKSAGHLLHKLVFLADLGLKVSDPGIENIVKKIMAHQDPDGPFQTMSNIPVKFGGSGLDTWGWVLCDAPLLLYTLISFGLKDDMEIKRGVESLIKLVRENGWPCAASTQFGTFRGPGRKADPCPYANLIMLKVMASVPNLMDSRESHFGAESILNCWAEREYFHPYIFYMGTDFCKLKAPLVWYDILNVVSVLSRFPWLKGDPRLNEMASVIAEKSDSEGRFTPESVWMAWKPWDFGQKKLPSPWMTFLAQHALQNF